MSSPASEIRSTFEFQNTKSLQKCTTHKVAVVASGVFLLALGFMLYKAGSISQTAACIMGGAGILLAIGTLLVSSKVRECLSRRQSVPLPLNEAVERYIEQRRSRRASGAIVNDRGVLNLREASRHIQQGSYTEAFELMKRVSERHASIKDKLYTVAGEAYINSGDFEKACETAMKMKGELSQVQLLGNICVGLYAEKREVEIGKVYEKLCLERLIEARIRVKKQAIQRGDHARSSTDKEMADTEKAQRLSQTLYPQTVKLLEAGDGKGAIELVMAAISQGEQA